jgi:hypothetical protein
VPPDLAERDGDRECKPRCVGGGPKVELPTASNELEGGLDDSLIGPGRGADKGPGDPDKPTVLMSSG